MPRARPWCLAVMRSLGLYARPWTPPADEQRRDGDPVKGLAWGIALGVLMWIAIVVLAHIVILKGWLS